jgi:DNA-binding CsgD family transcriptional regulator
LTNAVLYSRGVLRLAQARPREALADLLACGERQDRWGARNPAVLPWCSAAALAHAALGDEALARQLADAELSAARAFGEPRAIGMSLRAAGLVHGGRSGIALLEEAVAVLGGADARLELARALVDLGAMRRRSGQRMAARDPLRRGLDLAQRTGAVALMERARTELLATGARPRRLVLTGVDALTPSERRLAEMAADGLTNRQIAQALFVTMKTVEAHLRSIYRKLDIDSRRELASALGRAPAAVAD